ncbi:hypothetical protein FVE85_3896 [Porphyridium purpureum]|uniref:Uncharacterized protein n=1 Tax=Porphyridium purpureum TaxID=35688 RepID=A0A5J4YR22_PORPP|nr:hypothetical protein FVE85_3896 [Porphyridium purpureum]|eukprot:POR7838..scf229_5
MAMVVDQSEMAAQRQSLLRRTRHDTAAAEWRRALVEAELYELHVAHATEKLARGIERFEAQMSSRQVNELRAELEAAQSLVHRLEQDNAIFTKEAGSGPVSAASSNSSSAAMKARIVFLERALQTAEKRLLLSEDALLELAREHELELQQIAQTDDDFDLSKPPRPAHK